MYLPQPYRAEADVLAQHLASLRGGLDWQGAMPAAAPWVAAVRKNPPPFWAMESLLKEYPISSAEGLALMRLAEALLRVPDADTAMALTADQLGRADFSGAADSALARLSSAAISLSKKFLPDAGQSAGQTAHQPGLWARLGGRTVVAATLRAVQLLGRQFVLGQTIDEAMHHAASTCRSQPRLCFSYDMLGEGARTAADAQNYFDSYKNAIESIAENSGAASASGQKDGISIKLSALHPRYEDAQSTRVMAELVPRVWQLCQTAATAGLNLTIDAEEVDRLELSLRVFDTLAAQVAQHCPQWRGFGLAMQAYQTRSLDLVHHVVATARRHRIRLMCRLVKGAYWDAEIKRAQELGLAAYPVFTRKPHTDVSYLACARALLAAPDAVFAQFATHNAGTIAAILQMSARANTVPVPFEFQRLHGMGEGIYRELLQSAALDASVPVRIYAPVGQHRDLLAYLVRRLLENGANSSFVHQLADESVGMDALLTSPLMESEQWLKQPPASPALPLPARLYGAGRANSTGADLTVEPERRRFMAAWQALAPWPAPQVPEFDIKNALQAYATAACSYQNWSKIPVQARAAILRSAADTLDAQLPQFCALLVHEAFKTWGDAVAEVREAVDFLRYYADEAVRIMQPLQLPRAPGYGAIEFNAAGPASLAQAGAATGHAGAFGSFGVGSSGMASGPFGVTGETNELRLVARGVWVCISPWNFPLAIFAGQVAAALVTGNTVLAKPAEQTPGVAQALVTLLHAAGVPSDALQLAHGPGDTVGAALVALPGVAGVVFTGSTQVAKIIQRALAAKDGPIAPLIAETGGINAMVVDSTALPEQVVDAVVQSAFRSAGQRCSALRLLCVHEGIADAVIEMVRGAAQELVLGDPANLATDIGPVIDRDAFDNIQRHLQRLNEVSKNVYAGVKHIKHATDSVANTTDVADLADVANASHIADVAGISAISKPVSEFKSTHTTASNRLRNLVPPCAYEVARIADVQQEIFGPVLHIVRWSGDPLAVIAQINALGYGLTLGIQTRIDSRAQAMAHAAHTGNVYINRNMIGAVVGVQPFGGEGLSGTGPKAGGPHYLYRFCAEQTVTVNTTAAGGNAALLAG